MGVVYGAAFGIVFGLVSYAFTGGKRDFVSRQALVAERYDVLCEQSVLGQARTILGLGGTWPPAVEATPADAPVDGHTAAGTMEEIVDSVKDGMSGGQPPTVA